MDLKIINEIKPPLNQAGLPKSKQALNRVSANIQAEDVAECPGLARKDAARP